MSELRRDREWEHWPQDRRPEEGIRRKLRELFHPTAGDDEIEHALADADATRSRPRAQSWRETVADLERREARTHELRATVEQMLRRGSAELDERHAELSELAARLADRETVGRRRRGGDRGAPPRAGRRRAAPRGSRAPRGDGWRARRGAGAREEELASARRPWPTSSAQARELAARETELARRAATSSRCRPGSRRPSRSSSASSRHSPSARLGARSRAGTLEPPRSSELDRASGAPGLRGRAADAGGLARHRPDRDRGAARRAPPGRRRRLTRPRPAHRGGAGHVTAYVALVPGARYRLVERDDGPPTVGARISVDGDAYLVARLGASPLPGDRRRCAFLERDFAPDSNFAPDS